MLYYYIIFLRFYIIRMSIFTDTAIAEYSVRLSGLLSNYTLYNRSTFHKWFFGVTEDAADKNRDYETNMDRLTRYGNPCSNNDIGWGYSADAMMSAFGVRTEDDDYYDWRKKFNYDILFAMDNRIMNVPESKTKSSRDMLNSIVGVIILEKGECDVRPNSWCVKVICVKPSSVKGSMLMGACLYCIKNNPRIKPECLLELADGYSNLPAFYSYTALGFLRDDSLWGDQCFHTKYCMPMRADLSKISQGDIINKVLGTAPTFVLDSRADPSGLWNRKCYVFKYKDNAVLKEIQTISNLMLGLTLLKSVYKPGVPAEEALYNRYKSFWTPISRIIRNLSVELNTKLEEFDRLTVDSLTSSTCDLNVELDELTSDVASVRSKHDGTTDATKRCSGVGCNIMGGKSRKNSRGKKSRAKKTRSKKYYNHKRSTV
jgi:hypothetical protein